MKYRRLTLGFSREASRRLKDLKKTRAHPQAEVLREALGLYDWLTSRAERGEKVFLERGGERRELVLDL